MSAKFHLILVMENENVFQKWGGERFGNYPISRDIIDKKYSRDNGDCVEPDNFYPWTAIDDNNRAVGHFITENKCSY